MLGFAIRFENHNRLTIRLRAQQLRTVEFFALPKLRT